MAEKAITWYNRLKEAINGQIKQNGKREITGAKLNSVLNQMVDALGKNMTFGGVVSPATVIDNTDDNPVFYLALEAGNYPYCGNIVVGQGQIAFLFRDANNIWHQASWNASDENFTEEEKTKLQGLPTEEQLRKALDAKANAPESKPGSDNLASFDEDGNLKDSGLLIPVPGIEEKNHILALGENGLGWVPKPADGDDAYGVYVKEYKEGHGGSTDGMLTRPQWLLSLKGEKGDAGNDGHNPNLGTYKLVSGVITPTPPTPTEDGDYIVVIDDSDPTDVTSEIYKYNGSAWQSTGRDANQAYFGSREPLIDTHIDDTHLDNPVEGSLAKAEDAMQLKVKLLDVTLQKIKPQITTLNGYISGTYGTYNPRENYLSGEIDVNGFDFVIFLGVVTNTSYGWGYSFFDTNDSPIVGKWSKYSFDPSISGDYVLHEYKLSVPPSATKFRWTIKTNIYDLTSKYYAYVVNGKSITDIINDSLEPVNNAIGSLNSDIDEVSERINAIDDVLSENSYLPIAESMIEESKRCNSDGTIQSSTYIDLYTFDNIDDSKKYKITCKTNNNNITGIYLINYFEDTELKGQQFLYTNIQDTTIDTLLTLPPGTNKILVNAEKTNFEFSLYEVVSEGYLDIKGLTEDVELLLNNYARNLQVTIESNERVYIRCHYDSNNDILVNMGYLTLAASSFVKNCWLPQSAYIGPNTYTNSQLIANGVKQRLNDCVGPITMDFCGPIYANHGYCTPVVVINNNPLTIDDIGSIWHDEVNSLFGGVYGSGKREYKVINVDSNKVYLLPIVYGSQGDEKRDWVYYSSPGIHNLYHIEGATHTGDLSVSSTSRYDYQVCKCVNQKIYFDGVEHDLSKHGVFYCNELTIAYRQNCYDPCSITTWWPTPDYTNVPLKAVFDRQFIFSGSKGFFSYSSSHKMNVLMPFKMGQQFSGNPNGRYIGNAPTAFLKQTGVYSGYDSYTYIDKLVKQHIGNGGVDYDIDFRKEFLSNSESHPAVRFDKTETDCKDTNNLPDRLYSYLIDAEQNADFGFAGGHSIVRGMSMPSVRTSMITYGGLVGWWNPPVTNKLYLPVMTHGDGGDIYTVTTNFIRTGEGFFCWYKPLVTSKQPLAMIHSFYYKSGNDYILYIHTLGSHDKTEDVHVPELLNGKKVIETIEQSGDNISVVDDIIVSGIIHINVSAYSNDECNYIVLRL